MKHLDQEIIEKIEAISKLNYKEIYDEWKVEIADDEAIPPNLSQMKLDLLCLSYSLKNGEDPSKEIENKIKFQLEALEMEKKAAEYANIAA